MTLKRTLSTHIFAGASVLAIIALAGCSAGERPESEATPAAEGTAQSASNQDTFYSLLPQEIRDRGVIRVGTEAMYPPYEYLGEDGVEVVGLDMDLFAAVSERLGVSYEVANIAFDSLLPALDSGRYDVIVGAMTDSPARRENYDFIDYFEAGQSIVTVKDNPLGISTFADLCGQTVSVLQTSAQQSYLEELNTTECADKPIDILAQPSDNDALLQVQNGRAVGVVSQDPVAHWNAEKVGDGQFIVANQEPAARQPLGYVVVKGNTQLAEAFQAALQSLVDDGTYAAILSEYGVESGAIETVTINAGN